MKKKILFPLIISTLAFSLMGCGQNPNQSSKVKIDFGKAYLNETKTVTEMSYEDFADMITTTTQLRQSFVVAISNKGCGCWSNFEPILAKYNFEHNMNIRHVFAQNFVEEKDEEGHPIKYKKTYGLNVISGNMPSLAIFRRGKLVRQITQSTAHDVFYDYTGEELEKFMSANIIEPTMYYVAKDKLDDMISKNEEFSLYVARDGCGDCSMVTKTVLKDWLDKVTTVENPMYVFDLGPYYASKPGEEATPEEIEAYNSYLDVKYGYGLGYDSESGKGDANFGWGTGSVPTFQYRKGSEIKDMAVVFNDFLGKEENTKTTIVSTYFTAERVAKLKFLEGTGSEYVLEGKQVSQYEADNWRRTTGGNDYYGTIKYHKPILDLFLKTYVK